MASLCSDIWFWAARVYLELAISWIVNIVSSFITLFQTDARVKRGNDDGRLSACFGQLGEISVVSAT